MCERTCPRCKSESHTEDFGITGMSLVCDGCFLVLAHRFDRGAAPLDLADDEAIDAYALESSGVRPGAEARDPADDVLFSGTAFAAIVAETR
jgi:hypothetical protein